MKSQRFWAVLREEGFVDVSTMWHCPGNAEATIRKGTADKVVRIELHVVKPKARKTKPKKKARRKP